MDIRRAVGIALAFVFLIALLGSVPHAGQHEPTLSPEEQKRWTGNGFTPEDALSWERVGIGPAEAREWVMAGIQFAEWANQWKGEGFGPADAAKWVRTANLYTAGEFRKRGFSPAEGTAWMENGVHSALRAVEFRKIGLAPQEAGRWWKREFYPKDIPAWREAGFGPEEALEWKYGEKEYLNDGVSYSRSVFSVEWAREWRGAGFTSKDARRATLIGLKLPEVMAWKRAGFGVEEALHWRDSGFAPAKAAGLQAQGLGPVEAEERREAAGAKPEDEIASLHADIHLREDGSVLVTERFEILNRPGGAMQACFERVLPAETKLRYRSSSFREARPTYDGIVAFLDGSPAPVEVVKDSYGDRTLCIGGKGSQLPEGAHAVTLGYATEDRLIRLRDREELFFDVTGRYLKMPVRRASATVRLPRGADVVFADGFAGLTDRKDFTVRVRTQDESDVIDYAVWRPLKHDMGFQVSVGFTKGFVKTSLWKKARQFDRATGGLLTSLLILILGLCGTVSYYSVAWHRVGRDPKAGLVLREFEPPAGAGPALIRYIVTRRRVDDVSVAATLVHLAQHGAIRIDERQGAYQIRRTGPAEGCAPLEHEVLATVFGDADRFVLGMTRARATLRRARSSMTRLLEAEYRTYFVSNSCYLWPGLLLSAATVAGSLLVLSLPGGGKSATFLKIFSAVQVGIFGLLGLLFYVLLKTPTMEGRKHLDRIAGYRDALGANYRKEGHGTSDPGVSPFLERQLPYAMALGIECDRLAIRWDSTAWFTGRSGGFSVRDFIASLRRRAPGRSESPWQRSTPA
ncbi:MAG: DUF2207 domain-containing protein [candidate division NC10 bacterium]|nr:DUF2207 domain-containing protein [candidate division NC10 bacterium]